MMILLMHVAGTQEPDGARATGSHCRCCLLSFCCTPVVISRCLLVFRLATESGCQLIDSFGLPQPLAAQLEAAFLPPEPEPAAPVDEQEVAVVAQEVAAAAAAVAAAAEEERVTAAVVAAAVATQAAAAATEAAAAAAEVEAVEVAETAGAEAAAEAADAETAAEAAAAAEAEEAELTPADRLQDTVDAAIGCGDKAAAVAALTAARRDMLAFDAATRRRLEPSIKLLSAYVSKLNTAAPATQAAAVPAAAAAAPIGSLGTAMADLMAFAKMDLTAGLPKPSAPAPAVEMDPPPTAPPAAVEPAAGEDSAAAWRAEQRALGPLTSSDDEAVEGEDEDEVGSPTDGSVSPVKRVVNKLEKQISQDGSWDGSLSPGRKAAAGSTFLVGGAVGKLKHRAWASRQAKARTSAGPPPVPTEAQPAPAAEPGPGPGVTQEQQQEQPAVETPRGRAQAAALTAADSERARKRAMAAAAQQRLSTRALPSAAAASTAPAAAPADSVDPAAELSELEQAMLKRTKKAAGPAPVAAAAAAAAAAKKKSSGPPSIPVKKKSTGPPSVPKAAKKAGGGGPPAILSAAKLKGGPPSIPPTEATAAVASVGVPRVPVGQVRSLLHCHRLDGVTRFSGIVLSPPGPGQSTRPPGLEFMQQI